MEIFLASSSLLVKRGVTAWFKPKLEIFLRPDLTPEIFSSASPSRPPANVPSAPAYSLSANRLPATLNAHRPYSFGSVPPSPAVARRACVRPAISVGRPQSPATVPRPGADGRLLRKSCRAQSAPPVRSLRPREPQSSVGLRPVVARHACGVSRLRAPAFRSPN